MLGTGARPLALGALGLSLLAVLGCPAPVPPPIPPEQELIAKGRDLFFKERFDGNGRTCGTCHPAENNFALDASFIATLPPENPLFVAEFTPALRENFENPKLIRRLIGEGNPHRQNHVRGRSESNDHCLGRVGHPSRATYRTHEDLRRPQQATISQQERHAGRPSNGFTH
jgi:hypothetical protein